ncbi:hypothetical protein L6164_026085 [Bauhinia variegata]|uniref:Uncharacterized protein n=1 Tax=Bauhinia variegata TaxID=167791 RepID=A0ACB9M2E7_BAUVA|nr:hypothetical protein L6164_026085 [Bauhinia variegata]
MGSVLGKHDEDGRKERAIYYLSKKFTNYESRYAMIEKTCCALVWVATRLWQYMLYYTTWLISYMEPLKFIFERPYLSGRLAKWQIVLSEYDIVYMTKKSIKGSAIADHLADNPIEDYQPMKFEFLDEDILTIEKEDEKVESKRWKMYFYGVVNVHGSGIRAVVISPEGKQFPIVIKLEFECTNNVVEYEACVWGLKAALEFDDITFSHLTRDKNQYADALATLAVMTKLEVGGYNTTCRVAIDYFTKWVEAASYATVTQHVVVKFLKFNIICQYGQPERIITDNGPNLNGSEIQKLCKQFKVKHHNSSPYWPQMNGAVEAANKNIKKIIVKMVITYKDWHKKLPFALYAYRTSMRSSTGATPNSLVYGMEAVTPIEVAITSLRVLMEAELEESEWAKVRYAELHMIDGKRLAAICHGQLYQSRMARAFNKKVRSQQFQPGDLVL